LLFMIWGEHLILAEKLNVRKVVEKTHHIEIDLIEHDVSSGIDKGGRDIAPDADLTG